jgi:hypothetical protein
MGAKVRNKTGTEKKLFLICGEHELPPSLSLAKNQYE